MKVRWEDGGQFSTNMWGDVPIRHHGDWRMLEHHRQLISMLRAGNKVSWFLSYPTGGTSWGEYMENLKWTRIP